MRIPKAGLLLVMLLALGVDAGAQSDSKEPSAVISGKVTIEGAPAAGVPVMLLRANDPGDALPVARSSTDHEGNYRLVGIAAGAYGITAFAPAYYYSTSEYFGSGGKSIMLRDGEVADGIDFKLVRGGVIAGRVTDSSGKPVIDEEVGLTRLDENGREVGMPYDYKFDTDDRGIYRAYGLEPGRYLVSVGRHPGEVELGGLSRFYQRTFHPGVIDRQSAAVVEVGAGAEASGVDIALGKMTVTYSVSGRVVDADTGKGVPGVMIGYGRRLENDKGVGSTESQSDWLSSNAGDFRLEGVPPGRYTAFGVRERDSDFYSDQRYFDVSDRDVDGIEVKLHRSATITGLVELDSASDPTLTTRLTQLKLTITNATDPNPRFFPAAIAQDGSFRISGVLPGQNRLNLVMAEQTKGFYISGIQKDGAERPSGMIDVGPGEQVTGVKLRVSCGTGVIRGHVKYVGGTPPDSAMVLVTFAGLGANTRDMQFAKVDSRGLFLIDGLRGGEYVLTLIVRGNIPGRITQNVQQKISVTEGVPAEAVFVVDLSGQT